MTYRPLDSVQAAPALARGIGIGWSNGGGGLSMLRFVAATQQLA
jgi:hypothetical protein